MTPPPKHPRLFIPLSLVWAVAIGLVALRLGSFGILDNNEGLYAEISREMLVAENWRQWIIPHLNGLPYMEKPPLLYWLTALSFALFGEVEWAARAVPAISALACVALLLRFGVEVNRPEAGRLAALMFISGIGITAMSHVLMFDMLLTALLTASQMCAYRYSIDARPRFIRWAYGLLALAILAKGFVALILFGLVVGGFFIASRRSPAAIRRELKSWCEPWGVTIFLAIAVPWHLAASLIEPIFPWLYFINEHVFRFLGLREPRDYYGGSLWYYLPRMAVYLFPWSFLLPCLLAQARNGKVPGGGDLKRFLWSAWLAPLIFFSLSAAKANYYLVAVMPFAAFHLAAAVEDRIPLSRSLRAAPGLLLAAFSVAACAVLVISGTGVNPGVALWGSSPHQVAVWFGAGVALISLCAALIAWFREKIGLLAYLALPLYSTVALALTLPQLEPLTSMRPLARYLQSEMNGRTVYLYQNLEELSSLPFYLKRPIPIIDSSSSDLFWGNRIRPNSSVISKDQFDRRLQSGAVAVVVAGGRRAEFVAEKFGNRLGGEKIIGRTSIFFN